MVLAIIVTFNPNIKNLYTSYLTLVDQADSLLIVDNSSSFNVKEKLENEINLDKKNEKKLKINFIELTKNLGLGNAQNIGIEYGIEKNYEYFLFLDDDSVLLPGSLKLMTQTLKNNKKVGMVCPNILHIDSGKIQKYWVKNGKFYKRRNFEEENLDFEFQNVLTTISSGSLIPKNVINECGVFRGDFFIDYIDIEYCLRIQTKGYTISVLKDARLEHRLGATNLKKIAHIEIYPTNHSPFRRYFMIRNRIWTWKLYALKFPIWFLIDIGNFIYDNLRALFFEKSKGENLRNFLKGLRDGVF